MKPQPEVILHQRNPRCQLSIILLDWGVRESFHSLEYLNRQTVPRDQYELIWLEFYRRKPAKLREMVFRGGLLDQWIVAGYPDDYVFSKHRLYNIGLLLAQGRYCVICDSDAIFTPSFVAKLLEAFAQTQRAVIHLDEIRNTDPVFYPFCYPSIAEIQGDGCANWHGTVSRGLNNSADMLHQSNYGACMAAPRDDMFAIGGADEHIDYLGYICGPYEMTFRLANHGLPERWLRDEYLYHTWHPNETGINTDYQGPHDGLFMSLRALESRIVGRTQPCLENPWIARARQGESLDVERLMTLIADKEEPTWIAGRQGDPYHGLFLLDSYAGFNLF